MEDVEERLLSMLSFDPVVKTSELLSERGLVLWSTQDAIMGIIGAQ